MLHAYKMHRQVGLERSYKLDHPHGSQGIRFLVESHKSLKDYHGIINKSPVASKLSNEKEGLLQLPG